MHAHSTAGPQFFDCGIATGLIELQRARAAAVGRRNEEDVACAPNGRSDVQSPVARMWVTPEQFAAIRIKTDDLFGEDDDKLILAVDVDEIGVEGESLKSCFFQTTAPVF